jgi:hypothetical protein
LFKNTAPLAGGLSTSASNPVPSNALISGCSEFEHSFATSKRLHSGNVLAASEVGIDQERGNVLDLDDSKNIYSETASATKNTKEHQI